MDLEVAVDERSPPLVTDEERIVEICGCTPEAARSALLAAGPGGIALAVDLVIGGGSDELSFGGVPPAQGPSKLVCLVREDLAMGTGKVRRAGCLLQRQPAQC